MVQNKFDELIQGGLPSETFDSNLIFRDRPSIIPLAGEISSDGLVMDLEFNETSGDKAGDSAPDSENNEGRLRNGAKFTDAGELLGGVVTLDGIDDYISVKDSSQLNLGIHAKRTVALWFKVEDKNSSAHQVLYEEGGSTRGLNLYIDRGRLYIGAWNNPSSESNWSGTYLSTDAIASNRWHHAALVLNATEGATTLQDNALIAYLDGVQFGIGRGSQIWSHSDDIGIGGLNQKTKFHNADAQGTGKNSLKGSIDSVQVYNRALSESEIAQLAQANNAPTANNDSVDTTKDTAVTILATDLLNNDSDPDGDSLTLVNVANATNGSAALGSNGNVVFTPASGFVGDASFEYAIADGRGGQATATVTVSVAQPRQSYDIGVNLSTINYYATQLPFIDGFKSSKAWITQNNTVWDTNEFNKLDLDANGWVKSLPAPEDAPEYTAVGTLLYREQGQFLYPPGKYLVLYDGQGTIEYAFDAKKDFGASRAGRDVIDVTPSNAGVYLKITATDPNKTGDYIRNIRVIPINAENTYQTQEFNPDFVEKIQPFTTLRYMDWMRTNNSTQMNWSDRPRVDDINYGRKGVPIEVMVDLANQTGSAPWFSMPHMATDEYVTKFAEYVKQNLNPNVKIYVEYSNEVWNPDFDQYDWALEKGKQELPADNDFNLRLDYYSKRSTEVMQIWDNVFGSDKERVIGVVGAQAAFRLTGERVLQYAWSDNPLSNEEYGIDAIAIAPYFGIYFGAPQSAAEIEAWTKDPDGGFNKLFDEITQGGVLKSGFPEPGGALQQAYNWMASFAELAKQEDLELIASEGGQTIRGLAGVENNPTLVNFFNQANRDPRMGAIYKQYIQKWNELGGGLMAHYNDIGRYDRFNNFGLLEHVNQPGSPKYDALIDLLAATPSS
jgi:Cadherin-like domain/Concanavalin A-like lectin/glucanases superfamily